MQNRNNKNKIRTLCTIDTSDIDLQETKPKTFTYIQKNNNNLDESRQLSNSKKRSFSKTRTPTFIKSNVRMINNIKQKTLSKSPKERQMQRLKSCNKINLSRAEQRSKERRKSRIKTEYSTSSDIVVKSIISKSNKTLKSKLLSPFQETYNLQTYEMVQELSSQRKQKVYLTKKLDRYYIMKKTKDPQIKKQYQNQAAIKQKWYHLKWKNLVKQVKMYTEKSWMYAIYQYHGYPLSWNDQSHIQFINRVLKNQGILLKYIIKEVTKGIYELSSKGFVHGDIKLQSICMKIQQSKTIIKVEGNIKLTNFGKSFSIKQKDNLINLPNSIYTPPQIINLKLFSSGQKFDRELIQYISYYDQPWYVDVWALGVLTLQLIAGETISIQKVAKPANLEVSLDLQSQQQQQKSQRSNQNCNYNQTNQITLSDILQAQKSLLIQTEAQIQKISFDKNLQSLLLRMLSINPLNRPHPKQIIKDL